MTTLEAVLIIINVLLILCIFYLRYRKALLSRSIEVYFIRRDWLLSDDIRFERYTYDTMLAQALKSPYKEALDENFK